MKPINEDALKLHKACVKAAFECPQFSLVDNDWYVQSMENCLSFWSKQDVLWKYGYVKYLPEWALNKFSEYCVKIGYRALFL